MASHPGEHVKDRVQPSELMHPRQRNSAFLLLLGAVWYPVYRWVRPAKHGSHKLRREEFRLQ